MKALITGITGQDGSYMAELLLQEGYEVFGLVRRSSTSNESRIAHLKGRVHLIDGDLTDTDSITRAVQESRPDEIYNLGAMTFVPNSWACTEYTFNVNCLGLQRLIQASEPYDSKIYQASSSEMYGNSYPEFRPISPYGISKLSAHYLANSYRNIGRFICCGICFNHESPRRGDEFVTKKICNFAKHLSGTLKLGNLEASRDWGFAGDYVEAMWMMMQQDMPDDYEVATGETHTVREFLDIAIPDWKKYIEVDPKLIRPNEVRLLKGNPTKIKSIGWEPSTSFEGLVRMMCLK